MNKKAALFLIVWILFVASFAFLPEKFHGRGYDYQYHLEKTQGSPTYSKDGRTLFTYPPLFHTLAFRFASSETAFYWFTLFLLGILTPLLLYTYSKSLLSVFLYFTTTSYFYFMEQGVFGQALVGILLLAMLNTKNPFIRIGIVFLGWVSHNSGIYFLGVAFLVLTISDIALYKSFLKRNFDKICLACSGWFPTNRPDILNARLVSETKLFGTHLTSETISPGSFRLSFLLKFLFEIFPFPFFIMAIIGLWKKQKAIFFFVLFLALAGFFEYRIWFFIPLLAIPGLVTFYEGLKPNYKLVFLTFCFLYGILQFTVWFNYKHFCFPLEHFDYLYEGT